MKRIGTALIGMMVLLTPRAALATNGMNLLADTARADGMGGACLAVECGAACMNQNPAFIGFTRNHQQTFSLQVLDPILSHTDNLGNDTNSIQQIFVMPFYGMSGPMPGKQWAWGLGIFTQGGMGAAYKNLKTPFGTTDETYTKVAYIKLTPSLAYKFSNQLAIGLALNVGYSQVGLRVLPNTSNFVAPNSPMNFFGVNMNNATALGAGYKIGLAYKMDPKTTLGLVYTSASYLGYSGNITLDESAIGLGDVQYKAKMDGFTWPQEVGIGVSHRPNADTLLAADLKWVDWAGAIRTITINAFNPNNPNAPPTLQLPFVMDWKDQLVFNAGGEWNVGRNFLFRLGYSFGANPVPSNTVTPLFPAIIEHHLTTGFGFEAGDWHYDFAVEHALGASEINTNPQSLFGAGSVERHQQWTFQFTMSRSM